MHPMLGQHDIRDGTDARTSRYGSVEIRFSDPHDDSKPAHLHGVTRIMAYPLWIHNCKALLSSAHHGTRFASKMHFNKGAGCELLSHTFGSRPAYPVPRHPPTCPSGLGQDLLKLAPGLRADLAAGRLFPGAFRFEYEYRSLLPRDWSGTPLGNPKGLFQCIGAAGDICFLTMPFTQVLSLMQAYKRAPARRSRMFKTSPLLNARAQPTTFTP